MNDLEKYFRHNEGRSIVKWNHYFDIYERYFSRYKNEEVNILEIGLWQGGSLQMWKNYFGPKARIYGIDIDPRCKSYEEKNVKILIGSQSDRAFLKEVCERIPKVDILIDDGGHTMQQQITTYEALYGHVKDDGIYLCEDVHTSYWSAFGGGYKRKGTFIEYSKNFIDWLNAYHSKQKALKPNEFTRSANAVHFYDSMVIIEKGIRNEKPFYEQTGTASVADFDDLPPKQSMLRKLVNSFGNSR